MVEYILWTGLAIFVALIIIALVLYYKAGKFEQVYSEKIALITKIKCEKFLSTIKENYQYLDKPNDNSIKSLKKIAHRGSRAQIWFDYPTIAKEFLAKGALWLFVLGLSVS